MEATSTQFYEVPPTTASLGEFVRNENTDNMSLPLLYYVIKQFDANQSLHAPLDQRGD